MESNRKRRGIMKVKLMPFYRAAKPSSTTTSMQYSSMGNSKAIHQQDYVITGQPKQRVSFIVPADLSGQLKKQFDQNQNLYGNAAAGDDSVDLKAAIYISSVQERFKLERIDS